MNIYIDVRVLYVIGAVLFFGLGYFLSSVIWEKRYNSLLDSLPEGRTLFLGELTDDQYEEVKEMIQTYAEEHGTIMTFVQTEPKEDD